MWKDCIETDGHAEDTLKGADWALLSRAGFEGLAMCSRVEMNSLLIQSKRNGNLPSIYQLYNLFTTPSRRDIQSFNCHFSSRNT